MKELSVRIVSAVILAVFAILSVLYFPVWLFKFSIAFLSSIASWEVAHLLKKKYREIIPIEVAVVASLVSVALLFFSPYFAILIMVLYSFYVAHRIYDIDYLTNTVFIFVYGVFFVSSIAFLHEINRNLIFVLFATVWAGDTAAYFIGKKFGKHKLAPRVSPKKTWEGAVGSFFGSIIVGGVVAYYFKFYDAFLPIVISAVLLQIGDLFESFIKRQVQEKDSSHLIPGHGGLLDRIDALIFASVVFLVYYHMKFFFMS
ncbi:phosphatidate cytidylyltransferase [Persephonella sp.]